MGKQAGAEVAAYAIQYVEAVLLPDRLNQAGAVDSVSGLASKAVSHSAKGQRLARHVLAAR